MNHSIHKMSFLPRIVLFFSIVFFQFAMASENSQSDEIDKLSHEATSLVEEGSVDTPFPSYMDNPDQTIHEVFDLFYFGLHQAEQAAKNMSDHEWHELVEKDKARFENGQAGAVVFSNVDKVPIVRVIHRPSRAAFLFLDSDKIDPNSVHLDSYIARIHRYAGQSDQPYCGPQCKKTRGRNVILVWFRNLDDQKNNFEASDEEPSFNWKPQEIEKMEFKSKPSTRQDWFFNYIKATYKKPTKDDIFFGVVSGVLQFATGALAAVIPHVIFDQAYSWELAKWNFIFGTVIGSFSSTYRNIIYREGLTKFEQTMRSSMVSAAFAYTVMVSDHGLSSVSFMTADGWYNHLRAWGNVWLNNIGKTAFTVWANVLKYKREDIKVYRTVDEINLQPWGIHMILPDWMVFQITQRNINFQWISYLPNHFLRSVDLVYQARPESQVLSGFDQPLVRWTAILMAASSIPVEYFTMKWFEKKDPEVAKKLHLREDFHDFLRHFYDPLHVGNKLYKMSTYVVDLGRTSLISIKNKTLNLANQLSRGEKVRDDFVSLDPKSHSPDEHFWANYFSGLHRRGEEFNRRSSLTENGVEKPEGPKVKEILNSSQVCSGLFNL